MYYKISNGSVKVNIKKPQHKDEIVEDGHVQKFRLFQSHPLYEKKYVSVGKVKIIPDLVGPRIPDLKYDVNNKEKMNFTD